MVTASVSPATRISSGSSTTRSSSAGPSFPNRVTLRLATPFLAGLRIVTLGLTSSLHLAQLELAVLVDNGEKGQAAIRARDLVAVAEVERVVRAAGGAFELVEAPLRAQVLTGLLPLLLLFLLGDLVHVSAVHWHRASSRRFKHACTAPVFFALFFALSAAASDPVRSALPPAGRRPACRPRACSPPCGRPKSPEEPWRCSSSRHSSQSYKPRRASGPPTSRSR